ncbi:hypothetical protein F5Y03DRAFT_47000 [Xylaria venustula]|nr:hypothetical protein F5Y03DRAFT_47000 [Xylaria venustula]
MGRAGIRTALMLAFLSLAWTVTGECSRYSSRSGQSRADVDGRRGGGRVVGAGTTTTRVGVRESSARVQWSDVETRAGALRERRCFACLLDFSRVVCFLQANLVRPGPGRVAHQPAAILLLTGPMWVDLTPFWGGVPFTAYPYPFYLPLPVAPKLHL